MQAVAQGWSVLAAGCYRRGGQEPHSPLIDALAQYLHALPPERLAAALAGCAWLGRLLPELGAALEPRPAAPLQLEQERRLLFAAVARCLTNVAGPAGTLLVLNDLQWAGADGPAGRPAAQQRAPPHRGGLPRHRGAGVRPLGLLRAGLAQARLVRQHTLGPLAPAPPRRIAAMALTPPSAERERTTGASEGG